jgi:type IV secretory pathway ATPase VirB11/archaellum biosynthesis ATPase
MTLKDQSYFKEKENINGKKDITLILDCSICSEKEKIFFNSKRCLYCFLNVLFKNKKKKFDHISILRNNNVIYPNQYNLFLDYFKYIKTIRRINQKIQRIRNQKCKFKEFKCKYFPEIFLLSKIKDFEYYNPIFIYNNSLKSLFNVSNKSINDGLCKECYDFIKNSIRYILKLLNDIKIIKMFKSFQMDNINLDKVNNFYKFLFSKNQLIIDNVQQTQKYRSNINRKFLNSYFVGDYNTYKVKIFENSGENEKLYQIEPFYTEDPQKGYFKRIIQNISSNLKITELDQVIPLDKLIDFYKKEALKIIKSRYNLSVDIGKKICFLIAIKKLNLEKIFPLLVDDLIEEIFLDSPKDEIYINHQIYSRCRTETRFSPTNIDRIEALIRLYSGQRLDFKNPTIKYVIKNKFFYCRFSIDVAPIQINNFALDIRKLNKNILTIQDLLKNKTISPSVAAFLYFCILQRKNITVTGETDTGKTTLINALDLLVPKEYRKIYIENITESLDQFIFGKHQLKYKVDSLEQSLLEKYSKSSQIKTLLHRTPDIIYLGEILTKEEAEAMFQCLAAGLRGFQTIHSKNIQSLMNRFMHHFRINRSCLNDLDLVIIMKKKRNERRVMALYEICKSNNSDDKLFNSIFEFNPKSANWDLLKSLYETTIIKDIKKYEDLTEHNFMQIIQIYNELFETLSKLAKIDNLELIDFFHKISYYSSRSIIELKEFWNYWKKNRSLNF